MNLKIFQYIVLIIALFTTVTIARSDCNGVYVKLYYQNSDDLELLKSMDIEIGRKINNSYFQAYLTECQLEEITNEGIKVEIVHYPQDKILVDPEYHTYEDLLLNLNYYSYLYPNITSLQTIGFSQLQGKSIPAIKISDNPQIDEDEPAVLYDGLHHAQEPQSMEVCLALINYLLSNYEIDSSVTSWINNSQIWIVPIMNPDGWNYLVNENLSSPWWRKNQRDNDTNGIFTPDYDGVDINRNYGFSWDNGDSDPSSDLYRGPFPFSEGETKAKRALAKNQNFVLSITYHSWGQYVGATTNFGGYAPPDSSLIIEMSDSISSRIPRFNSNNTYDYATVPCDGGYSDCWMYAINGCIEFTVETSPEWMSLFQNALQIAQDNIQGALYLLKKITNGPGITGHITDSVTNEPLVARIKILELEKSYHEGIIEPRLSDSLYGRYYRLLHPGNYTVEFSKTGYQADTLYFVQILESGFKELNIQLNPNATDLKDELKVLPKSYYSSQNYPNPFNPLTKIKYSIPKQSNVSLKVFDILGNEIAELVNEKKPVGNYEVQFDAAKLSSGVYFYRIQAGEFVKTKKMVVLK